jgi:hypothetical protein
VVERPKTAKAGQTRGAGRQERLAAALRENLKRRKAQARAQGNLPPAPGGDAPDAADPRKDKGSKR